MLIINSNMHLNINGTTSFFINITKESLKQQHDVLCIINKRNLELYRVLNNINDDKIRIKTVSNNRLLAFFQYSFIYMFNRKNAIAIIHDIHRIQLAITKVLDIKSYVSIFGEGAKKLYKSKRWLQGILPAKKYHYDNLKVDYPNNKIMYFPYMVELDENRINKQKQEKFTFGCLGAFIETKGFRQVILASDILRKKYTNFQVFIGGGGSKEEELKQLVNDLKLGDYVKFVGKVSDKDTFYNKLDVFVFSTYKEDIGMVIPEAISYRVPIMGNRIGFLSDILTENEYLMVEAKDLEDVEKIWPAKDSDKIWWQVKTNYRFETQPLDANLLAEKMDFAINNYETMKKASENAYNKIGQYSLDKQITRLINL